MGVEGELWFRKCALTAEALEALEALKALEGTAVSASSASSASSAFYRRIPYFARIAVTRSSGIPSTFIPFPSTVVAMNIEL